MKCHYINDKEAGRVLIPGCMGVAVYGDMDYCTCKDDEKTIIERIAVLETQIQELQKKMHDLVLKVPNRYEL